MTDFDASVERTDNFLAHFGVKGMKWGKRKAEDSGPSASQQRTQEIHDARSRQDARANKATDRHASGMQKTYSKYESDVSAAKSTRREALDAATNRSERKDAKKEYRGSKKKALEDYWNGVDEVDRRLMKDANRIMENPDAATADRLTRGEKLTTGLLLGAGAAMTVGPLVAAAASDRR